MACYQPYSYPQAQFSPVHVVRQNLPVICEDIVSHLIDHELDFSWCAARCHNDVIRATAPDSLILLKIILAACSPIATRMDGHYPLVPHLHVHQERTGGRQCLLAIKNHREHIMLLFTIWHSVTWKLVQKLFSQIRPATYLNSVQSTCRWR